MLSVFDFSTGLTCCGSGGRADEGLLDFIVNRVGPTSMTRDVFGGKTSTELESLNGHILGLARRVNVPMPFNQATYEIAKERFCSNFKPIQEIDLWEMINDRILDRSQMLIRKLQA